MSTRLNLVELDIMKEIITIGIAKAADSLSFFINEKVILKLSDIKINIEHNSPLSRKYPSAKNYLLKTEIKGEIKGESYLLFNENESKKIAEKNFPKDAKINSSKKKLMTEAFLLEIDNIMTANVVTQFSNIFQKKIYGDVPSLFMLKGNEINKFLSENHNNELNVIYFNARFNTKSFEINPEFIFMMDDVFFENVKSVVSMEKKLELFEKSNKHNS